LTINRRHGYYLILISFYPHSGKHQQSIVSSPFAGWLHDQELKNRYYLYILIDIPFFHLHRVFEEILVI